MPKSAFLESVRVEIRTKHYSIKTEKTYLYWIKQFILYNDKRHPNKMSNEEIERFLNYIAAERKVSASTQNLALYAIIFNGKGKKDRYTLLPESLIPMLKQQMEYAKEIHDKDLTEGFGSTSLPPALHRKYKSSLHTFTWQYLFPSTTRCKHPYDGYICRHHIHDTAYSKQLRSAVITSKITKRVTAHTFRHSFATQLQRITPIDTLKFL